MAFDDETWMYHAVRTNLASYVLQVSFLACSLHTDILPLHHICCCCSCRWCETMALDCGHLWAFCSPPTWYMCMEPWWNSTDRGKTQDLRKIHVPVPLLHHKSHRLNRAWTQVIVVRGQWLTFPLHPVQGLAALMRLKFFTVFLSSFCRIILREAVIDSFQGHHPYNYYVISHLILVTFVVDIVLLNKLRNKQPCLCD
jgi:hypothetical protein